MQKKIYTKAYVSYYIDLQVATSQREEGGMEKKETSLRNHKETSGPQWDHCDLMTINSRAYDKKVGTGCA